MKELAIIGPTASGKTELALKLAGEFNGVILSLDSLCVYKQIDIASAKPSEFEQNLAPHFGINLIYPDEHFDVGMFFKVYKEAKEFALRECKNLFITGGSGFYLKALMSGLTPKFDKVESGLSNAEIYEIILNNDSEFAAKFSQNDTYRLNRWFDIYSFLKNAGIAATVSGYLAQNTHEPIILNLDIFEIVWDREILRERIKTRTQNMLENGLLDEAKFLFEKYPSEPKPLKSIGLKECGEFLRGEIKTRAELEELICTHTAQLAKRQRTFNRSQFDKKFSASLKECETQIKRFLSG
ncbi:tRNA (adenosine(37)-N6)-dimethylallyltransferase MiaA [Campylobacter sp.]|uniref:tRNA (adenosine(37)-N6)-dimethylallyltransferase MiaA n=1 Tax=Campylobacter sp. TaxID=205 RepID=UPI002710F248|nr:tRNA (adenosine(37)-N6)-dimethylallyltransferase MiaA [Campylobacter sp.]